jgi:hypothetical protein
MPQYLVAIHLPDNYDPSAEGEEMVRDISSLNKEMVAAGVRIFVGGLQPAGKPNRCVRSPMVKCSSPTDRTSSPKNTWAVFGYWKPQIWTRR